MHLGDLMLIVTLIVTVGAIAAYIAAAITRREEVIGLGRSAYLAATVAVVGISAYFMWLILANHYELKYIFENSSHDLPLLYKISVFWAGQQGSFLFWALVSGLLGIWVMLKAREFEPWMMAFWSAGQLLFLVLLLIDSPFKTLPPEMLSQVTDGQGLRELLQNPWMAVHPPLVFIGYAAMCVPAAFAVAGLIDGNLKTWCRATLPWAVFGWVTLGAGIILGAYWAYEVLGWGGYWGWDPVENASLIPWLTGTALLHGMLAERYRGSYKMTNVGLALVTFLFVFYATFLTRSNALEGFSVHTFGDARIGPPLLIFMGLFVIASIVISAIRWPKSEKVPIFTSIVSKDYAFLLAIMMFVLCASVVLIGTSVPIFAKIAAHGKVMKNQVGVDAGFYNKICTPIAFVILALMALAPVLPWKRDKAARDVLGPGILIAALVLAIPFIALFAGKLLTMPSIAHKFPTVWNIVAGVAMAAVAVVSFIALITNARTLGITSPRGVRLIGSYVAHVGMGLMFVGVVTSVFGGPSKPVFLSKGSRPVELLGYKLSYEGQKVFSEQKEGLLVRIEHGRSVTHAMPMMQMTREQQMLASPAIVKSLARDIYIAPKQVSGDDQRKMARGQSVAVQDFEVEFAEFIVPGGHGAGDVKIGAHLIANVKGKVESVTPFLIARQGHKPAGIGVPVPGMSAKISLDKIRVEEHAIDITLTQSGGGSESITLQRGNPASSGDYKLLFTEWYFPTGDKTQHSQVGAVVEVTRGGRTETVKPIFQHTGDTGSEQQLISTPVKIPGADSLVALSNVDVNTGEALLTFSPTVDFAVVDVSVKPFISLLWLGAFLALIGGCIAMWRRSAESVDRSEKAVDVAADFKSDETGSGTADLGPSDS